MLRHLPLALLLLLPLPACKSPLVIEIDERDLAVPERAFEIGDRALEIPKRDVEIGERHLEIGDRALEISERVIEIGDRHLESPIETSK